MAAAQAYQGAPLTGPLSIQLDFVFPRSKQQIWKTKPMPRLPHTKKPDVDNVSKAIFDCLNKVLWYDDSQIVELRCQKWIASGDEQPHVEIHIYAAQAEGNGRADT